MKQTDTLPTQYRHIEHLLEEVWCQKINYWQNDSFVNLAIFFIDQYFVGGGYLISSAYFFFHFHFVKSKSSLKSIHIKFFSLYLKVNWF